MRHLKLTVILPLVIALVLSPFVVQAAVANVANYRAYAEKACAEAFEAMPIDDFEGTVSPFIPIPGGLSIANAKQTSFSQQIVKPEQPYSGANAVRITASYADKTPGAYDHWVLRMPPLPFRGIALDRRTHFSLAWRGSYISMVVQIEYADGKHQSLYYTDQAGPRLPNHTEDALRQNTTWKVITTGDIYEWAKQRAVALGTSDKDMYVYYVGLTTVSPNPFDITVDRMVVWQPSYANCAKRS